ncbi:unnamed protein product [Schistosoma margrebowiei]|uniref:Uncharacterized protein n=1 Tax=Schistosoma margrebowiei TaxID=48269 RepID=A0A3P8G9F0_9TREM|nr:unnamed protein product [Schistosoma margrebowiei]
MCTVFPTNQLASLLIPFNELLLSERSVGSSEFSEDQVWTVASVIPQHLLSFKYSFSSTRVDWCPFVVMTLHTCGTYDKRIQKYFCHQIVSSLHLFFSLRGLLDIHNNCINGLLEIDLRLAYTLLRLRSFYHEEVVQVQKMLQSQDSKHENNKLGE